MPVIHSIEMFEDGDNRSTTPMPFFAAYADDVRLFTVDAELIVQVEWDYLHWHITHSDYLNCYMVRDETFRTAEESVEYALALMNIPISEFNDLK